mmetsp:Transcript_5825/g.6773  ORF Transcript_5825/g.6773 Transcript_5825/m.6773 type:complete len:343 (+) Transcript_5825:114-1142(+)
MDRHLRRSSSATNSTSNRTWKAIVHLLTVTALLLTNRHTNCCYALLHSQPMQQQMIRLSSPLWSSSRTVFGKYYQTKQYCTRNLSVRKLSSSNSPESSSTKWTTTPSNEKITGVIFDMDGTLIKPCIDFADMRKRIYDIADTDPFLSGNSDRGDVLELYALLSPAGQIRATEVFSDIEQKANDEMTLMDGASELCNYLDSRGIKRAVLTRNVDKSIGVMHNLLWKEASVPEFTPAVSRDTKGKDGITTLASKPSPDGIRHICDSWNCTPQTVIMVGDSSADDMVAASRANCAAKVLLQMNGMELDNNSGGKGPVTDEEMVERQPSLVVSSLGQLLEELKIEL